LLLVLRMESTPPGAVAIVPSLLTAIGCRNVNQKYF
jgi:hypothetical protein